MKKLNYARLLTLLLLVGPMHIFAQLPNLLGNGSSSFDNSNPCRLSVSFDYTNDGFAPAGSFTSGLYLTTDQFAADPDFDILAREVTNAQGCNVGVTRTLTFTNIDISGLVQSGQLYYVYVYLDSYDDQQEMDEDDNLSFVGNTNCNLVGIIQPDIAATTFQVSPNPAMGALHISAQQAGNEKLPLQVIDATGRIVMEQQLSAIGNGDFEQMLDVSTWARGIYYVRIGEGQKQLSRRVILQ